MEYLVLKIGGSVLAELPDSFYDTVVALKQSGKCEPIIVHGGGPEINDVLERFNVETQFVEGLRVTTKEVLHAAEMVMSGSVNKRIVSELTKANGIAVGLSGVDSRLLQVVPQDPSGKLGFVGKVTEVNVSWLELIINHGNIPVISPISTDEKGQKYNVNGDMAAAAVAEALEGKLGFITDIPGVMETIDGKQVVHPKLTEKQIQKMIDNQVISGGMIPKVRSAINGLKAGAKESIILNGKNPEDLKNYIDGEEAGTKIVMEKEIHHV